MNGKGSKRRPEDAKKLEKGWAAIDWSKKAAASDDKREQDRKTGKKGS